MVFAPSVIMLSVVRTNLQTLVNVHARTASYVQIRVVPKFGKEINLLFRTGGDGIATNGDSDKISSFNRQ